MATSSTTTTRTPSSNTTRSSTSSTKTVEKSEERYLICNPARFGGDFIPTFTFEGFRLVKIKVFRRQGLDVTREEIRRTLAEERIPYSHALIDENGVAARSWTI